MEVSASGIVAVSILLHPANAALPMKTTVPGMSMDFNPEPLNAPLPMWAVERGILIDASALQSKNAWSSMDVIESGRMTDFSALHLKNALWPTKSIGPRIATDSNWLQSLKTKPPT